MGTRYIVGDCETTGVDYTAKVVEIAWLEIDDDFNVVDRVRSLINPECHIPAAVSAIHGITDSHVESAPTIEEFMMTRDLTGETVLVAHNAPFDSRFFSPFMPNLMGTLCTLRLARVFIPDADNHKLQTLRYYLGLNADVAHHEAHTAMADVKVLFELLKYLADDTGLSLQQLVTECNKPRNVDTWPIGKYKGQKLSAAPRSYVQWALKNMSAMDADLRRSLEALNL